MKEKMEHQYEERKEIQRKRRLTSSSIIAVILGIILFTVCGGGAYAVTLIASELTSGAMELDEGSGMVKDGAKQLVDGSFELSEGGITLKDGVKVYTDGVAEVHEGVGVLQEGVTLYTDGVAELNVGAKELHEGIGIAKAGTRELQDGSILIYNGLAELNSNSPGLREAPDMLIDALNLLWGGLELMPKSGDVAQLTEGSTAMNSALETAAGTATDLSASIKDVQSMIKSANDESKKYLDSANTIASLDTNGLIELLQNDPNFASQVTALANSYIETNSKVKSASSANTKVSINAGIGATGLAVMSNLYKELNAGVQLLNALPGGVKELQAGIDAIKADVLHPTDGLKVGIFAYTDGVKELLDGSVLIKNGLGDLNAGLSEAHYGTTLISNGTAELHSNSGDLKEGVSLLSTGVGMLHSNSSALLEGTDAVNGGVSMLSAGLQELHDGTTQLNDGTSLLLRTVQFKNSTKN